MDAFDARIVHCALCPRACHADRTRGPGACGGGARARVARAAPHAWEEPPISGRRGSGTVFFSGCSLQCCFCQNHEISAGNFGKELSAGQLGQVFLRLADQGVHNINLVSAGHYIPQLLEALDLVRHRLAIPIVYNSGGYERVEALRLLEGYVDVYLPDLKYRSGDRAGRYSAAPDYFDVASRAIVEMHRQVGGLRLDGEQVAVKGLIVRHLVLPGGWRDSVDLLDWLARALPPEDITISLMSQFTPCYRCAEHPEINRRVTTYEYQRVVDHALALGFPGYMQERSSAKEEYTPPFDLEGLE